MSLGLVYFELGWWSWYLLKHIICADVVQLYLSYWIAALGVFIKRHCLNLSSKIFLTV